MTLFNNQIFRSINPSSLFSAILVAGVFLCMKGPVFSTECCGKIEAGPTYLHLDVLESGHTIKEINMGAIKADVSWIIWKGICLKPSFLYGRQGHSEISSGGCGLGQYIPLGDKCSITPSIGCNFTQFKTNIHLPVTETYKLKLQERFRSVSPYLGLDASYCFCKGWRIIGVYQYVWSQSWTKIKGYGTDKSRPKGSNYGLVIERDLNDNWSVNVGTAYNQSLTKEKHGLRACGARIAIAYWF